MDPSTSINFHKELDARGLNCPLPILRTKKALTDMRSGEVLRVVATDPGSVKDFQAFSRQTGNALLASETSKNEFVFLLQKK
jgi:tRNA 2-thiouridine synthesizing protein A